MAAEKWVTRLEAKMDALLEAHDLKPADFAEPVTTAGRAAPELTAAEQQAIDNAPKTPPVELDATNRAQRAPARVTATNAPDTSASVPPVPADAVGNVTVETKETDGDVTVDTMPVSEARRTSRTNR